MTDPAMAYWNNLPFQGFHTPDFLRIQGGKYKTPYDATVNLDRPEGKTPRQLEYGLKMKQRKERNEAQRVLDQQQRAEERIRLKVLDDARRESMEAQRRVVRDSKQAKRLREASDRRAAREAREKASHERVVGAFKRTAEEREHHKIAANRWLVKNGCNVGNGFSKTILTDQQGKVWEFKSVSDAARYLSRSCASVRGASARGTLCNGHAVTIQPGGKWRGPKP